MGAVAQPKAEKWHPLFVKPLTHVPVMDLTQ